jgi:S-adenosylmethionine:diacylglycerol 3-amino-3-carboxypropyl transferase
MADVLRIRLRKLFGDFALQDNYFAMQALTHSYGVGPENSLPPYLQLEHYHALKSKAERLSVSHRTYSDELKERPEHTLIVTSCLMHKIG